MDLDLDLDQRGGGQGEIGTETLHAGRLAHMSD